MDITAPLIGWNPTTCEDYRYMIRYTDDIIELHRIQVRIVDEIILLERLRTLVSDTSSWAQFIVEREGVLIQLETANTTRTGLTKKFRAKCTEVA